MSDFLVEGDGLGTKEGIKQGMELCGDRRDAPAGSRRSARPMTHHYSHVDEGEKRVAANRVLEVVLGGRAPQKQVIEGGIEAPNGIQAVHDASQAC